MKPIVIVLLCCLGAANSMAQSVKEKLITDRYSGKISGGKGKMTRASLALTHEPYADDGSFVLQEDGGNRTGSWTVLRGDATNRNATVVELFTEARSVYFLRRRDGNLQQLDSTLHEVKPIGNNLLSKTK